MPDFEGFSYQPYGKDKLLISCYYDNSAEVRIPSHIDGQRGAVIAMSSFMNEAHVQAVYIPETVERILDETFIGCVNLEQFVVDRNNPNYCDIDGVLYSKDKRVS